MLLSTEQSVCSASAGRCGGTTARPTIIATWRAIRLTRTGSPARADAPSFGLGDHVRSAGSGPTFSALCVFMFFNIRRAAGAAAGCALSALCRQRAALRAVHRRCVGIARQGHRTCSRDMPLGCGINRSARSCSNSSMKASSVG